MVHLCSLDGSLAGGLKKPLCSLTRFLSVHVGHTVVRITTFVGFRTSTEERMWGTRSTSFLIVASYIILFFKLNNFLFREGKPLLWWFSSDRMILKQEMVYSIWNDSIQRPTHGSGVENNTAFPPHYCSETLFHAICLPTIGFRGLDQRLGSTVQFGGATPFNTIHLRHVISSSAGELHMVIGWAQFILQVTRGGAWKTPWSSSVLLSA